MKRQRIRLLIVYAQMILINICISAQNPVIRDQFTADPSARVFNGRVYLYPSHDIPCTENRGRIGWFCMEDYHVFSSEDLTDWTDNGVIVSQKSVKWVDTTAYSMWAPDCVEKNGKYYFYFPSRPNDTIYGRGFKIGVAISDKPEGPFIPQSEPIKNVHGIDPNVFIDKDGQAYLLWSARKIFIARLKENMLELASEPMVIENLSKAGLIEGPYMFERNGIYYLTYPHVENKTERLEYAVGNSPLGPFKVTGVIMDESPTGCWTNHHSVIEYNNQWYLFYHHNDFSPDFDKNRSVRVDSMFFNDDGTIRKVIPSLRGVGVTGASKKIHIDRYSFISDEGISIAFIDTLNNFGGWKTVFNTKDAWIQYNDVDFGDKKTKTVQVNALSQTGGTLHICLNKIDGPVLSVVKIPKSASWITVSAKISKFQPGIHNLVVVLKDYNPAEIDWIRFK